MEDLDFGIDKSLNEFDEDFFTINKDKRNSTLNNKDIEQTFSKSSNDVLKERKIKSGYILNPFFITNENENKIFNIERKELYEKYGRIFIIRNKGNIDKEGLNKKYIETEKFYEFCSNYELIESNLKILNNKLHKRHTIILDEALLKIIDKTRKFQEKELVLPLIEINLENVKLYNEIYTKKFNLNEIKPLIVLYKYYNEEKIKKNNQEIVKKIRNWEESEYWTSEYNCNINMTNRFNTRKFQFKEKLKENIASIICNNQKKINSTESMLTPKKENKDYIKNIYRKTIFTDISSTLQNKKYKLYKIPQVGNINKETITNIFLNINNDKILYSLFCHIILSKENCDLVLNNRKILEKMEKFFNSKYQIFLNYIMGYGWLCMYMEECIKKTRSKNTDRYVFEMDTANKLPVFPYCHEKIEENAYCILPIEKRILNSKENCHGLPMIMNYDGYGIDTQNNFKKKLNIFMIGNPEINILEGLEVYPNTKIWKNIAISGSIITACVPKKNPLMKICGEELLNETQTFTWFKNEYYNESDIDVMCNCKSVFSYIDKVKEISEILKINLQKINSNSEVKIEPFKSLHVSINSKYIREFMKEYGNEEEIIKKIDQPQIKEKFYFDYIDFKKKNNIKWRNVNKQNDLYETFYKIDSIDDLNVTIVSYEITKNQVYEDDSETYIYYNDIVKEDQKVNEEKNILLIKISENIKYKIKSNNMLHNIEIFRTRYEDFFSCVAKFHLPCVRGYYNGETTYLLPSCITAMMTYTNIDYKYFAGIKDPIDIINKYRMRGFGTLLNETEKKYVIKYNSEQNKWNGLFKIDKNQESKNKHLKYQMLDSEIYKPTKYIKQVKNAKYKSVMDIEYILTPNDINKYYKLKYNYTPGLIDYTKLEKINNDGTIKPFAKWTIEASFEDLK